MRRTTTGKYIVTNGGDEPVRAFVPNPLPPLPPVFLEGDLLRRLEAAILAIGRLDGVSTLLPDKSLFLYSYVRKEAVLSSQIEGTQSTLSDLLLFELEEAPGVPLDDVVEVSNYVAALDHGIARLREPFPSFEPTHPRDPRRVAVTRTGEWQGSRRVPPVAELDRWQPTGYRGLRPPAARRRRGLHGRTRAVPSRNGRRHSSARKSRACPRPVRDHPSLSRRQRQGGTTPGNVPPVSRWRPA